MYIIKKFLRKDYEKCKVLYKNAYLSYFQNY